MRLFLAVLLVLLASSQVAARPNIVVIMTDDQEDTGSMDYMPRLHALIAERGLTFKNSFVNLPLCAPSRASFFTGQAAHNHGIKANNPLDGGGWEAFKSKEDNTLPVWLKAAGYTTALLGKYLNYYGQQGTFGVWLQSLGKYLNVDFGSRYVGAPRDWVPAGWDLWYAFAGTRPRYFDYSINENGTILNFGGQPSDYSTDVLKDRAVRFILDQTPNSKPFFLFIAPKAAHAEGRSAVPSPKYEQIFSDVKLPTGPAFNEANLRHKALKAPPVDEKTRQELANSYRAQLQTLQSVDELVQAVANALQDSEKLNNTVIIYTSDNGFLFGDHRLIGKSAGYEGSIKVPLVIRGPGIPENETREQLVSNLDVVATILDLAGAAPGVFLDGRSLASLFTNAKAPWRSALLIEGPVTRFDIPAKRYTGVRTLTKKYIKYDGGFEELFDLSTDPHELTNEARKASDNAALPDLRAVHNKMKSCSGASCWMP